MVVDITKIKVAERLRKDFGGIEELAEDIKRNGLLHPPVVTPDMELIAGERRLRAMRSLGWQETQVTVVPVRDVLHQFELEVSENENRRDLTYTERMMIAPRLRAKYAKQAQENQRAGTSVSCDTQVGRVNDRVAERIGISASTLSRGEYVFEHGDEEMIRAIDEKQLSVNAAYKQLKQQAADAEAKVRAAEAKSDMLEGQLAEATDRIAELEQDTALPELQAVEVEVYPEDYEDTKAENERMQKRVAALEKAVRKKVANPTLRVYSDEQMQQRLEGFRPRIIQWIGDTLTTARTLALDLDLLPQLDAESYDTVYNGLNEVEGIRERLSDALRECPEEKFYSYTLSSESDRFLTNLEECAALEDLAAVLTPKDQANVTATLTGIMAQCAKILDQLKAADGKAA